MRAFIIAFMGKNGGAINVFIFVGVCWWFSSAVTIKGRKKKETFFSDFHRHRKKNDFFSYFNFFPSSLNYIHSEFEFLLNSISTLESEDIT